jgi:hypothetical protein
MRAVDIVFIERISRPLFWCYGLAYAGMWWFALLGLDRQGFFTAQPDCMIVPTMLAPLWYCGPSGPLWFLASLADAAMILTVWSPVFAAAAWVDPAHIAAFLPIVMVHAVGLVAATYILYKVVSSLVLTLSSRLQRFAVRIRPA